MEQKILPLFIILTALFSPLKGHTFSIEKFKDYEHQLEDVMEIININYLKEKLIEVEAELKTSNSELNRLRVGIVYHEVALNLTFLTASSYKGYAQRSVDILTSLFQEKQTTIELLPYIVSYQASAMALVSAETNKIKYLNQAFKLLNKAVKEYGEISYLPEFLRGSIAENLPWIFINKRKYAKKDFDAIIDKYNNDNNYASAKIMSFTYWAWANQHKEKRYRKQTIAYLNKAIMLDPNYKGGRQRAEDLLNKLTE